ncbi:MAG: hypothetical protein ABL927_12885, partial [Bdellovibrionales bacterium]
VLLQRLNSLLCYLISSSVQQKSVRAVAWTASRTFLNEITLLGKNKSVKIRVIRGIRVQNYKSGIEYNLNNKSSSSS